MAQRGVVLMNFTGNVNALKTRKLWLLLAINLPVCTACSDSMEESNTGYSVVTKSDAGADRTNAGDAQSQDAWKPTGPDAATPSEAAAPEPDPYPIVLHHGFSGWQEANLAELHYFYGVAEHLNEHGESEVFETVVEPYHGVEERASQLAVQLDQILLESGADKVNIIAHSQEGSIPATIISTTSAMAIGSPPSPRSPRHIEAHGWPMPRSSSHRIGRIGSSTAPPTSWAIGSSMSTPTPTCVRRWKASAKKA